MTRSNFAVSCCLSAALFVAGCAVRPPTQSARDHKLPEAGPDQQYHVVFPDEGRGKARYVLVTIGGDISETCGLVQAHFEFDSTEPLPEDKLFLQNVANCLKQPALRGRTLSIVGHADVRGNLDYNMDLGLRRAEAVKQLLVDAGVSADQISTSSGGEIGARGGDNKLFSYGYDRRVDVVMVSVTHRPR